MKKNKGMVIAFITPAALSFLIMYVYPVLRTVLMSFFKVESLTQSVSEWKFNGIQNFIELWKNKTFQISMVNISKIWLVGGAVTLLLSLLFAVILTSGVRGKSFWRAVIYLPNVISAVALATMWVQYVFNKRYGLITLVSDENWLSSDMKFWAMLVAFIFGAVGYYMLIFLSGIEQIPADLYEAATIDGASRWHQFTRLTLPLLKGVIKTNLTFWSVNVLTFFVWSQMFSPVSSENSTVTPVVYLYSIVFGDKRSTFRDPGRGAAVGVMLALLMGAVFMLFNKLIREEDIEM